MDVYLVPIARDRFASYYEVADADEPVPVEGQGFFARLRTRFATQLREAEDARHKAAPIEPEGTLARWQRRMMRWIVERIAEQRLLWHLGRAHDATLHAPDTLDAAAAEKTMRAEFKRDADRHLRLLVVHGLALALAVPVALLPGPNIIGYFFTFTTVGHFLSWRGARRANNLVRWQVTPSADLTEVGRALTLDAAARHHRLHELAEHLHLPHLAAFVERMAAPPA